MVKRLIGSDTTGTDGSVSIPYTGTGAGVVNLSVETEIDGSIVSETYEVLDCYRYDEGLSATGHHNDIWTGINNTDLTREAEYTTIKEKTVGTTATITFANISLQNYRIECDVYQVDGTQDEWCVTVLDENYNALYSADSKLGEWKHITFDMVNMPTNSRVRLNTGGSCTELRFKNFKLYPIGDSLLFYDDGMNSMNQRYDSVLVSNALQYNGHKFYCTSTSASARASLNPVDNASAYDFQPQPMVFEFDLVQLYVPSSTISAQFIQQNPTVNKQIPLLQSDGGHTIKIKYTGTALEVYVDGVHQSSRDVSVTFGDTELMRVGFAFYAENGYVTVKNLKAYLI